MIGCDEGTKGDHRSDGVARSGDRATSGERTFAPFFFFLPPFRALHACQASRNGAFVGLADLTVGKLAARSAIRTWLRISFSRNLVSIVDH